MVLQSYDIKVQGVVQGVGFRPFIYHLAQKAGLSGSVMNTCSGVLIRLECRAEEVERFISSIKNDSPPLAQVSSVQFSPSRRPIELSSFSIINSSAATEAESLVPQDTAVCRECLNELNDAENRRHRYPFINCTNCGPRFTIIEKLPYDRPNTSMKSFSLCPTCTQEYKNPADRRFHAQPIGCWLCGPSLSWHNARGERLETEDCIQAAQEALNLGKIIAIKGLGGFHLSVDATNDEAVALLRKRKIRKSKPLAIMAKNLHIACRYAKIDDTEEEILSSNKSPIVLVKKASGIELSKNVAPGIAEIGIMLPYTPLHHLLFNGGINALVMTSGNKSGQPICIDNEDALLNISNIADFFLLHNRKIVARADDSVVRVVGGKARMLRRSRGYVPENMPLPYNRRRSISCGAGLKNTFCLTRNEEAFIGQHIGDLDSPAGLDFFKDSIEHLQNIHEIKPEVAIIDLHADYLSSRYGINLGLPIIKVQHHHAHAAGVAAEHDIKGPYIGVILDGTGLGPDRTIWGGEILFIEKNSYRRLAHIDHLPLPGGEAAAREPWRMAMAMLWKIYGENDFTIDIVSDYLPAIPREDISFVLQMIQKGINSPETSSCGRLFDGVAALINQRMAADYEGQPAMELESLAWNAVGENDLATVLENHSTYSPQTTENESCLVLDISSMINAVLRDREQGVERETIALKFHLWLIKTLTEIILKLTLKAGRLPIVLSGGCMQNRLLLEGLLSELSKHKFSVYAGEKIPMNDAGISFGQAAIGGGHHVSCNTHGSR